MYRKLPISALLTIVLLMLLAEQPAKAYTDPGSGALIWQMLMAALVGASFYVRRLIAHVRRKSGNK